MSIPTKGEEFAKLMEYLRKAQESAAMMSHLYPEGDTVDRAMAAGWMAVSERLRIMGLQITQLATRGLQ